MTQVHHSIKHVNYMEQVCHKISICEIIWHRSAITSKHVKVALGPSYKNGWIEICTWGAYEM